MLDVSLNICTSLFGAAQLLLVDVNRRRSSSRADDTFHPTRMWNGMLSSLDEKNFCSFVNPTENMDKLTAAVLNLSASSFCKFFMDAGAGWFSEAWGSWLAEDNADLLKDWWYWECSCTFCCVFVSYERRREGSLIWTKIKSTNQT